MWQHWSFFINVAVEIFHKQTKTLQRQVKVPEILNKFLDNEDIIDFGREENENRRWQPDMNLYRDDKRKLMIKVITSMPNLATMVYGMYQVVLEIG